MIQREFLSFCLMLTMVCFDELKHSNGFILQLHNCKYEIMRLQFCKYNEIAALAKEKRMLTEV